jgi:hypothetical protein
MKKYKEIETVDVIVDSIICDKCGKISSLESQVMDLQEWFYYSFIGGYKSIFEDGGKYEIDLCQECTKELLGQFLNYLGNRTW